MMEIVLMMIFLASAGVVSQLNEGSNTDKAAIIGNTVTLPCGDITTHNRVDLVHDLHHKSVLLSWNHYRQRTSENVLMVQFSNKENPKLLHNSDIMKYMWSSSEASLTIRDVDISDAGSYDCITDTGSIKHNISSELFVFARPQCENLKPLIDAGYRGKDRQAYFNCTVQYRGSIQPEVIWKHGDRTLNSHLTEHNESYISTRLFFGAETEYNGYKFQCEVGYPFARVFAMCETSPLQILFPVHVNQVILDPHADKHVYQSGKDINLSCRATGNPQPKYRWSFRPKGDNFREVTLATEARYTITDAQLEDEGIYNCTVSNNINGTLYIDTRTRYIKISDNGNDGDGHGYRYVIIQTSQDDPKPQEKPMLHGVSPYAIGAIICAVIAVILILVFFVLAMKFRDQCFLIQMKKNENQQRFDLDENMDDQEVELLEDSIQSRSSSDEYGRLKLQWEIPRKEVRFSEQIASGCFAEVWKGKMKKYPDSNEIHKVAIKKLKENANEQERKFFLAEMEVQKMLQPHPNVVLLIGCYTYHEPWLLMLEYAQEGTLYHYLLVSRPGSQEVEIKSHSVRHKNVNSHRLLAIAAQVVNGLMHLLKFKLIYYRLKTSNILVGRGGICKLSGFGFPHEIKERNLYEEDTRPVGWMCPESIRDDIYSYRTDIWSYGILLWEVIHFGLSPYLGLDRSEISEKILSGEKLVKPSHCSEELYKLMMQCWEEDPLIRKEYPEILQELSILAADHSSHILIDNLSDAYKFHQAV